jgi:hypothetical protein
MNKGRPATHFQTYRLNRLGCFKLVPPGEGEKVDWNMADLVLRDAAAAGLWTPRTPSDVYPRDKAGTRVSCERGNERSL